MQAQEISDALRYSQSDNYGTARFRAMSGAFGALGGDLSAINVNPAGSAIFANHQIAATGNISNTRSNSNYFGTQTKEKENSIDLNQLGGVFVFTNRNEKSDWKKFSIAVNYENLNNFDNTLFSAGTNPNNSVTQYFTSYANGTPQSQYPNGIPLHVLQDYYYEELDFGGQQASLAYQAFLINPVDPGDPNNTDYTSNVAATGNYYQENETFTSGYNGKLSVNAGTQYKNWLYLGINLNAHFTDYTKSTSFYEDYVGATNADAATGVQALRFNNDLYTYGSGFSFQFGAIAKVTKDFRLGLAYESPTWLTLNDELTQSLATDCADCPQPSYYENPGITNIYEPYQIQTPDKWTGSMAYVFGKMGLLSVDVSTKDYGNTKLTPKEVFRDLQNIKYQIFDCFLAFAKCKRNNEKKKSLICLVIAK